MSAPASTGRWAAAIRSLGWVLLVLFAACGPKHGRPVQGARDPENDETALLRAMATCERGDKAKAIDEFLLIDFKQQPLFPPSSPLSLTERQFSSMVATYPGRKVEAAGKALEAELRKLKALCTGVIDDGNDAARNREFAKARQRFTKIGECGEALDGPNSLAILKLAGQALKKRASQELASLPMQ